MLAKTTEQTIGQIVVVSVYADGADQEPTEIQQRVFCPMLAPEAVVGVGMWLQIEKVKSGWQGLVDVWYPEPVISGTERKKSKDLKPTTTKKTTDWDAMAAAAARNAKPRISMDIHEKLWSHCKTLGGVWFAASAMKAGHDMPGMRSRWLTAMYNGKVLDRTGDTSNTRYRLK